MQIAALKTRMLMPPQDDFFGALTDALPSLQEQSIVAVSSKAVAIGEGRAVPIKEGTDIRAYKEALAQAEADYFIQRSGLEHRHFTIIHGSLMGSAGIDESNGDGHLILWPEDPMSSAETLRERLCAHYGVRDLGVVVVDSHSMPLHNGAIGIAIGYAGFLPLKDYRHHRDLFGRQFKVERLNIADSLASAASFVMGEGDECTPAAVFTDVPHVTWSTETITDPYLSLTVPPQEDVFHTFLKHGKWEKGGGGYTL